MRSSERSPQEQVRPTTSTGELGDMPRRSTFDYLMERAASTLGTLAPEDHRGQGLHLLLDGHDLDPAPLMDLDGFRRMMEGQVTTLGLVTVGTVHHAFPGAGFTSVFCLTESHLSIHTWPEHGRMTFDVYLSNYSRDNTHAVEALASAVRQWLGEGMWHEQRIQR